MEISDTELGIPGAGTRRRWLREAAPGFVFSMLAPKQIAGAGFALGEESQRSIEEVASFAKQMKSRAVVFAADEGWGPTRENRKLLRAFVEYLQGKVKSPVLDLPGWPQKDVEAAVKKLAVTLAFDPLGESPAELGAFAYLRLSGPSGYRSRYDPTALDRVVAFADACEAKDVFVVFRNIDRFENSRYVQKHLALL